MARLLGYKCYADYNLEEHMAQDTAHVYQLLEQLLEAYTPTARQEVAEVEALARETEGADFRLMPWDWSYYSQKLKDKKYRIDDEQLRPYFELDRVKEGIFGLANKLYGFDLPQEPGHTRLP